MKSFHRIERAFTLIELLVVIAIIAILGALLLAVFALVCFFCKQQTLALGLVAWMATNFVVYRLGCVRNKFIS